MSGPVHLHAPRPTHPVLENTGGWEADPLLVSGADAYAAGEYLFQDFVYDAYGANTTDVPLLPPDTAPSSITGLASAPTGDVTHPTDAARYGANAGDLLEFRVRPVDGGIAYRLTMNTMLVPDAAIIAIGIDADQDPSTGTAAWPAGIGTIGPLGLEHVLVTWGTGATFDGVAVPATVDVQRNQIQVTVPVDPGGASWRHHLVTGIHDPSSNDFAPVLAVPDDGHAGGAKGTPPPPVLNVGFRFADQEPMGTDITEFGGRGVYGWGSWREHAQAHALAARDISAFHADIDFAKLARGDDDSGVPTTGYLNRLLVSGLDLGEGVDGDVLVGPIQPYALYVPDDHDPAEPVPFTLLLHAAACNYNQYGVQAPQLLDQLHQARGGIVATPMARGQTVGYAGIGEVDTFEVWADVASRYRLDFDRVGLAGISMGGIGSFRLASLYPDLFGRVFPIAGHGSAVIDIAENLRNVELLMWNGLPDELVRADQFLPYQQRLEQLGYRHRQDIFPLVDHLVRPMGTGTDFSRGAAHLGTHRIDRDPRRVTYRVIPSMSDPSLDLVYDRAYWVSGITVASGAAAGTVDITDHAADGAEPVPVVFTRPGTDPEAHVARGVEWLESGAVPRNAITADLAGISALSIDLRRTDLVSTAPGTATVTTDVPVTLELTGLRPGSPLRVGGILVGRAGPHAATIDLEPGTNVVTFGGAV